MAGKEIKKMKFFGYEKDSEKLMKLSEATFDGTLEELVNKVKLIIYYFSNFVNYISNPLFATLLY